MHHPPLKSVLQNVTLKRTVVFVSNKRKPLRKICRGLCIFLPLILTFSCNQTKQRGYPQAVEPCPFNIEAYDILKYGSFSGDCNLFYGHLKKWCEGRGMGDLI